MKCKALSACPTNRHRWTRDEDGLCTFATKSRDIFQVSSLAPPIRPTPCPLFQVLHLPVSPYSTKNSSKTSRPISAPCHLPTTERLLEWSLRLVQSCVLVSFKQTFFLKTMQAQLEVLSLFSLSFTALDFVTWTKENLHFVGGQCVIAPFQFNNLFLTRVRTENPARFTCAERLEPCSWAYRSETIDCLVAIWWSCNQSVNNLPSCLESQIWSSFQRCC